MRIRNAIENGINNEFIIFHSNWLIIIYKQRTLLSQQNYIFAFALFCSAISPSYFSPQQSQTNLVWISGRSEADETRILLWILAASSSIVHISRMNNNGWQKLFPYLGTNNRDVIFCATTKFRIFGAEHSLKYISMWVFLVFFGIFRVNRKLHPSKYFLEKTYPGTDKNDLTLKNKK